MKLFKLLFFNFILIFIFLLIIEFTTAYMNWGLTKNDLNKYYNAVFNSIPADEYLKKLIDKIPVEDSFTTELRPDINVNSTKKSIILSGCSFTYGDGLSDDEIISAKLGKKTGRPVYNLAGRGWGLSHFLFLTDFDYFYQKYNEPEYLFFVFIENHICRMNKFKIEPLYVDFQPRYKFKNNQLVLMSPTFFDRLVTVETYQYHQCEDDPIVLYTYFKTAYENLKKHWKNTKFVILKYPTSDDFNTYNLEIWNTLGNEGICVVDLSMLVDVDLRDNKYKVDGWHPTSEAWDKILPSLVKKLEL